MQNGAFTIENPTLLVHRGHGAQSKPTKKYTKFENLYKKLDIFLPDLWPIIFNIQKTGKNE